MPHRRRRRAFGWTPGWRSEPKILSKNVRLNVLITTTAARNRKARSSGKSQQIRIPVPDSRKRTGVKPCSLRLPPLFLFKKYNELVLGGAVVVQAPLSNCEWCNQFCAHKFASGWPKKPHIFFPAHTQTSESEIFFFFPTKK